MSTTLIGTSPAPPYCPRACEMNRGTEVPKKIQPHNTKIVYIGPQMCSHCKIEDLTLKKNRSLGNATLFLEVGNTTLENA